MMESISRFTNMSDSTATAWTFDVGALSAAIRSLDQALQLHIQTLAEEAALNSGRYAMTAPNDDIAPNADTEADVDRNESQTARPSSAPRTASKLGNRRRKQYMSGDSNGEGAPELVTRLDRVKVYVRVIFMKVGSIDTIHDRFSAEVLVQSRWREPMLDGRCLETTRPDAVVWEKYWNPRLYVENAIGEQKCTVNTAVRYNDHGQATVYESRLLNGSFFEFMELNKFPFDSQDLTVTLISEVPTSHVELIEDDYDKCGINAKAFSAEQEWHLHKVVNVWHKVLKKTSRGATTKFPGFCCAAKASRRPQFFIWNIIVIMSTICSLAFVTFTVALNAPQFRLQLTFILLLTTVTFKFVVNKSLPRISYLTYMDKYILGSMVILCGVCVWHAVVGAIINPYTQSPNKTSGCQSSSFSDNSTSTVATVSTSWILGLSTIPTSAATILNETSTSTALIGGNFTGAAVTAVVSTSTVEGSSTSSSVCNAQSSTSVSISCTATVADNIALGILSSLYFAFHLVFVGLIYCCSDKDKTKPNIEVDDHENDDNNDNNDNNESNGNNGNNGTVGNNGGAHLNNATNNGGNNHQHHLGFKVNHLNHNNHNNTVESDPARTAPAAATPAMAAAVAAAAAGENNFHNNRPPRALTVSRV